MIKPFYVLVLLSVLTQCNTPSDKILKQFDSVNNSIRTPGALSLNQMEDLIASIDSYKQAHTAIVSRADSLYFAGNIAIHFIDSLKEILNQQDSSGVQTRPVTQMFISSSIGDSLKEKILNVYKLSYSALPESSGKASLDSIFSTISELQQNKNWKKAFFENTPTVGALTMLTKFKYDCQKAAVFTLTDIKSQLSNQPNA
jgi:hypothetical protein